MSYTEWAILLYLIGAVILVAEVFIPSHGLLGLMGGMSIVGAIVVAFMVSYGVGLAALLITVAAMPFAWAAAMKIWPKTPIGRRVLLPAVESELAPPTVQIGQSGVTVSELRPMGMCEFEGQRVEVMAEYGMIPAGTKVRVVNVDNRRPVVRET
jgi:membrane-bound ClpP family serine protease